MKKFIAIFITTIALCSCRMPDNLGFNQPITLATVSPDGPPEYKAGWHDGCKSALAVRGNNAFANSWIYQEGKGPEFGNGIYAHDPAYQAGWGQAWFSCAVHTATFVDSPAMKNGPLE